MREDPASPARPRGAARADAHTVAVVVFDGIHPFEFAVPCEVFGLDRSDLGVPWYRFLVCAVGENPVSAHTGFAIHAPHDLSALSEADTIVVPGWNVGDVPPPTLLDALRAAHARGARLLSVCSGAFLLAEAGLLDGKRATTHWIYTEQLAREHPGIDVDPDVLYVDEGQIMTSAGTAAGIDLCLHVVRLDWGAEVANALARRMVVPPHRDGGQSQFIEAPVTSADDDRFEEVLAWMQAHLEEDLSIADMARRAALSPRTFARRFRATTGTTPYRWLVRQRVLAAQQMLETTDHPVEIVAQRCGFGAAATLRQHFRAIVGTAPTAYRETFRAVADATG